MRHGRLLILAALALLAGLPVGRLQADDQPAVKRGVDDIQDDINQAIDKGILWLLEEQQADGSWGQDAGRYPSGMTGLALYTLLKSGVPAEHPCVALGFANLLSISPQQTYAVACQLLALGASGNPAYHPRMAALTKRLLGWEERGSWSYPFAHEGPGWADRMGNLDLSNAQFAVLGLYAAHRAGIAIPRKVVQGIVRQTRFHQQLPRDVGDANPDGTPREAAGFAYHGPGQSGLGPATGSMTCAGITVLELSRRLMGGKVPGKQARVIDDAIRHALTWLEEQWSVEENPGKKQSHKLYYLYGLERVGSLLGLEKIGTHAWYAEGARALLAVQKDGGAWGKASETSFALLFLLRATKGEVTGEGRARSAVPVYATSEDSILRLRAEGHSPMKAWITSVNPDARSRYGTQGRVQFEKVEYVVNDEVQLTLAQGPTPHGADETYRALLHFPRAGTYRVVARGYVKGPDGEVVLESTPLEVKVKLLVQPWARYEASWRARDLRVAEQTTAMASTQNNDHQGPEKAVDRVTGSYWVSESKPADPLPTLHVRLRKALKANAIVLSPVPRRDSGRTRFDKPQRIEVLLNGRGKPIVIKPEEDELCPTVVRLQKPVRIKSLEITIPERTPGKSWPGEAGFREVAIELEPVVPPTHAEDAEGRVTLTCETPGAEIHYTLDGTAPTRDAPRYEGPFTWPGRTRLHAVARLPSGETSRLLIARTR